VRCLGVSLTPPGDTGNGSHLRRVGAVDMADCVNGTESYVLQIPDVQAGADSCSNIFGGAAPQCRKHAALRLLTVYHTAAS
jgi:hypothetical protein